MSTLFVHVLVSNARAAMESGAAKAHVNNFWGALGAAAAFGVLNAILPPLVAALLPLVLLSGFLLILVLDALMRARRADARARGRGTRTGRPGGHSGLTGESVTGCGGSSGRGLPSFTEEGGG